MHLVVCSIPQRIQWENQSDFGGYVDVFSPFLGAHTSTADGKNKKIRLKMNLAIKWALACGI